VRGGAHLTQRAPGPAGSEGPTLPPVATGLVLGLWITVLLVLALVVVPALFSTCTAPVPA
jgi:hypothetical protein